MRTTLCSSLTRCITFAVAVLAMGIMARPTSAQNCVQDEFAAAGNHQSLQCTANDVSIAFASNPRKLDGTAQPTCVQGTMFSFVADFHVTTTASARENIGLYFQTAGGPNALSGTCSDNIISKPHFSSNANDTVCLGSGAPVPPAACTGTGTYEELDPQTTSKGKPAPDDCGDISTADNNQVITVEVDNAICQAAPGTNLVALPDCTSWQQPGGTIVCETNPTTWPYVSAAIPGSPSKCNCNDTFTVPIVVQSPSIAVGKACNVATGTGSSPNPPTFDNTMSPPLGNPSVCSAGVEGVNTVTYTVEVVNTSNVGNITLDQICDTAYGNIATASGFTPACLGGTAGTPLATNNTCAMPQTILAKGIYTCSFQANQGENLTVNDIATANGIGSDSKTGFTGSSSQVTVTSTDAPSAATITKSLNSIQQACVTARYNVDIANGGSADENLTLTALTDDQVDITTVSSTIPATTCSQPQTLNVGGSDYKCTFDRQFCAAPTTITIAGTCNGVTCSTGNVGHSCTTNADCSTTCTGIQHTDTVTGTFTGDDPGDTVAVTPGTFTANVCVTTP